MWSLSATKNCWTAHDPTSHKHCQAPTTTYRGPEFRNDDQGNQRLFKITSQDRRKSLMNLSTLAPTVQPIGCSAIPRLSKSSFNNYLWTPHTDSPKTKNYPQVIFLSGTACLLKWRIGKNRLCLSTGVSRRAGLMSGYITSIWLLFVFVKNW